MVHINMPTAIELFDRSISSQRASCMPRLRRSATPAVTDNDRPSLWVSSS